MTKPRKPKSIAECIHYWAHDTLPEARSGRVSYHDGVLYSYAEPIARIVSDVVLHHTGSWSITTTSHQSQARMATNHMKGLLVPYIDRYVDIDHRECQNRWMSSFERAVEELRNHPRRKISVGKKMATIQHQWNAYREHFELDWPDLTHELIGEVAELRERMEKEAAARAEREREERIAEEKDKVDAWRSYEYAKSSWSITALRLTRDGREIETTHGARVPVSCAEGLWGVATHCLKANHEAVFNERAYEVGNYRLNKVGADGALHIGCHHIPFEELERMAAELGLPPYQPFKEAA